MNYDILQIQPMTLIGLEVRTNNFRTAATDIGKLWQEVETQGLLRKLPMRISDELVTIYTDYESDYRGDYTCFMGFPVPEHTQVPAGLVRRQIEGGSYAEVIAEGVMPQAVSSAWQQIWQSDLKRLYKTDFQVHYSPTEIDIYVGVMAEPSEEGEESED